MTLGGLNVGNATDHGFDLVCQLGVGNSSARLAVSTAADLSSPSYFGPVTADAQRYVRLTAAGLPAATVHYWGVEENGVLNTDTGRVRTLPTDGQPASFTVGGGSCMVNLSAANPNAFTFDRLRDRDLAMFLMTGDLHYHDYLTTDPELFRSAYRDQLGLIPRMAALQRFTPWAYMVDDHDGPGGDNGDSTGISRGACMSAYKQCVAHYPFAVDPAVALGQTWRIGRVVFVMPDTRMARDPDSVRQSETKTMLGPAQLQWLKDTMITARDGGAPLIVLVSTNEWIDDKSAEQRGGVDSWGTFWHERRKIANFVARNGLAKRLCMITGDGHTFAVDDGSNNDYSSGGGARFPVMNAAPLNQIPGGRGGPYSSGRWLNQQQYGLLSVVDTGGPSVNFTFSGYTVDPFVGTETLLYSKAFTTAQTEPAGAASTYLPITLYVKDADGTSRVAAGRANTGGGDYAEIADAFLGA